MLSNCVCANVYVRTAWNKNTYNLIRDIIQIESKSVEIVRTMEKEREGYKKGLTTKTSKWCEWVANKSQKIAMEILLMFFFICIVDLKDEKFNGDVCRFAFNRCGSRILIYLLLHTRRCIRIFLSITIWMVTLCVVWFLFVLIRLILICAYALPKPFLKAKKIRAFVNRQCKNVHCKSDFKRMTANFKRISVAIIFLAILLVWTFQNQLNEKKKWMELWMMI